MHSQCFLVLHQTEGCELVKLWAASGTFPVVDRQREQQSLRWAACRDSHFISWSAHKTLWEHPFTGRAAITSQIHRRRGSTDTEPLTNGPERGAAPQMDWLPPSRVWLMKTSGICFVFLLYFHLIWVYPGGVMVLFYMGSDKTSSTVMQPEDPVRQDMQFYYVVSGGITYSRIQMYTSSNAGSNYMIMFYI